MSLSLFLSIIALTITIVCLGFIFKIYKQIKSVRSQTQVNSEKLSDLPAKINLLREEVHEIRSGSLGINKRVKEISQDVVALQSSHQLLAEQDPQSRFYNKAAKLINEGASLSDVIQECGMPTAEAELLFNLHRNKN